MAAPLKVLMLFDLSIPLTPDQYEEYFKTDDWESERNIYKTLQNLGHDVKPFGLHNDLNELIQMIKSYEPDLVFNLNEAFRGERKLSPHIVSMLEMLGIPYTGCSPEALHICKDKGLAKKILSYHRVHVPNFLISRKSSPLRGLGDLKFPVFIKPLDLEASEGISQLSFAEDKESALDRVKYLHERYETSVIVEEYVDGRELYIGVIGNEKLQAFPPRELYFRHVPENEPKFASFRAKWDDNYRKKWGIKTAPMQLDPDLEAQAFELAKRIYRALNMSGYGRIDFRMTSDNRFVCLEANPNPSIEKNSDFALSAVKAGMSYEDVVQKIINLALGAGDPFERTSTTRKKKK